MAQSSVASTGSPGNRSFGGADLDASNLPEPGEDAAPASGGEPSSKPRRGPKPNTEEWYENDDGFLMEEDERPDIAYMLKQLLLKGSSVVAYADRLVDFQAQEGRSEEGAASPTGALHGSALASAAGTQAESPSKKKRGRPAGSKDKAKRRSKKEKENQGAAGRAPARSGSVGHLVPYWDDEDTPISRIRDEIARLRGGGVPTDAAGVPLAQSGESGGVSLTAPAGSASAASGGSGSGSSSSTSGGGMEGAAEDGL